ncbi:MAG: hypothetical protein AAF600_18030 [Bacteroidota bacterium]
MIISTIIFKEYQKYKCRFLTSILLFLDPILIAGVLLGLSPNVYVLGCLGLINLLIIGSFLLASTIRFETIIDDQGVSFRWLPIQKSLKRIEWSDVDQFKITNWLNVKSDFHTGDSIKYCDRKSKREGLYLKLKNKKNIFIGTQRPNEMRISIQIISS